eukprot:5157392-Amphidinium_carterae.1
MAIHSPFKEVDEVTTAASKEVHKYDKGRTVAPRAVVEGHQSYSREQEVDVCSAASLALLSQALLAQVVHSTVDL